MLVSKDSDANSKRNVLDIVLRTVSVIQESVSAILVGKAWTVLKTPFVLEVVVKKEFALTVNVSVKRGFLVKIAI